MFQPRAFYFFWLCFSGLAQFSLSCISIAGTLFARLGYIFPQLLIPRFFIAICRDFRI